MNKRDELVRSKLTKSIRYDLYATTSVLRYTNASALHKASEGRLGLLLRIPIHLQDPMVAANHSESGIGEIDVRWEPGLFDGPTNSRIAVVDYNSDTGILFPPARWNQKAWRFENEELEPVGSNDPSSYQFHQLNVWTKVQSVLEYFEDPNALGRLIPWGFEGNRLLVVPHAGYGENAYYDRRSKSLQFYYFGKGQEPHYTCLSHDIVAHETGHAVLDGIRPHYMELSSLETAAFHEYIGDLSAILLALHNQTVRSYMAEINEAYRSDDDELRSAVILKALEIIGSLAEEFGQHVKNRRSLRSASDKVTMADTEDSTSPHDKSMVLTSAMFEILARIAPIFLAEQPSGSQDRNRRIGADSVLRLAADSFRRISLQPLDLCPPADIRFVDYARAVLHNDTITNPLDERGYRKIIKEVFHEWGLCQRTDEAHAAGECDLSYVNDIRSGNLIYHDVDIVSRSRTAAYHFLDDNRAALHIPGDQDFFVADLYDNNKYGPAEKWLPREIVVQYLWREPVPLEGPEFGALEGQSASLLCGGTIVFDGRGNIISWFRKPGTAVDADRAEGEQRRLELLEFIRVRVGRGMLTLVEDDDGLMSVQSPTVARIIDGELRIEITPHLREMNENYEGEACTVFL